MSVSLLAGCGGGGSSTPGGGGGGGGGNGGNANSITSTVSANGGTITLPTSNGISPTFTYPSSNIAHGVKVTFTATSSGPAPYGKVRTASASASAFYSMTFAGTSQTVTFNGDLSLSYSGSASNLILEIFDATNSSATNPIATCPETSSSGTVTFTCSGSTSIPNPNDTFYVEIVAGSSLVAANAFNCPTSDGTSSVARVNSSTSEATHRPLAHLSPTMKATTTGQIAVVYNRAALQRSSASFTRSEQSAGASLSRTFDYPNIGKTIHVLSVSPSQSAAAIAALRTQAGVLNVAATERRYSLTSTPLIVSNHYFAGFAPSNAPPFYEAALSPGQWDMHAIKMEYVYGYSTSSNSTGSAHPGALGTPSSKIAVIDTGQDTLHPDLQANVVYQKCFITNAAGSAQSTSDFSTDPEGHGTDVSGIAAAVTNPSSIPATTNGFAGAGGNSGLMAYRVFPTPDDNCANDNSNDPQCGADTTDIAAAINDAVSQHASVISMSLGGGGCTNGVDSDPIEGPAVEAAIAANVVVVAASGNEYQSGSNGIDAPGCDTGVIAVGATSLDDGTPNGTSGSGGNAGGNSTTPVEYVASYSNSGGTNVAGSATSWGIVAPGGDPSGDTDNDDLHWIENIWTSTPFMANSADLNFAGECTDDYSASNPNASSATVAPVDCRTLIAGTSMATPHVAGVVAIICGLNPADCNPTAMKALLCQTADSLTITSRQGCGRLNAYRAVAIALSDPSPP